MCVRVWVKKLHWFLAPKKREIFRCIVVKSEFPRQSQETYAPRRSNMSNAANQNESGLEQQVILHFISLFIIFVLSPMAFFHF